MVAKDGLKGIYRMSMRPQWELHPFEDQIAIHGSVPIEQGADGEEQGKIEFRIPGKITKVERKARL